MSDQPWVSIIAPASALLGSMAGYLASAIQSGIAWKRQVELEEKKRRWSVEDSTRQHRIGVLMRRADQVEEFVYSFTEDFQNIRHAALFILQATDPAAIQRRMAEYAAWREGVPKRVYAYGPGVASLGRPGLTAAWNEMHTPFEELRQLYIDICNRKERDPEPLADQWDVFNRIDAAYEAFNRGLASFLSELDGARALVPPETAAGPDKGAKGELPAA